MSSSTLAPVLPANDTMSTFADDIYRLKYAQPGEDWPDTARRVVENVMGPYLPELVEEAIQLITERKLMPGGRYLYASGRLYPQVNNCLLLRAEDSREGWAELMQKATLSLMTGAGIGVVYSQLREEGALVRGMGGTSTGPLALMQMVNEAGRHIMQGGSRRAAIWAGLHWSHPDCMTFIHMKDWSPEVKALKEKDFNFPAPMDTTNISVILDDAFFDAYWNPLSPSFDQAQRVYWSVVENMLTTGEPGFSIDIGANAGEHLRNACTELVSRDDSDVCLAAGSPVLTRAGWKPIEAVTTLDEVATLGGEYEHPSFAGLTGRDRATLQVTTSTGAALVLTPNHQVRVAGRGWVRADALRVGDPLATRSDRHAKANKVALVEDEDYFALGWLVGDGWYSQDRSLGVCAGPNEAGIFHRVSDRLEAWTDGRVSYQTQANGVLLAAVTSTPAAASVAQRFGLGVGTATHKQIPAVVWTASVEQKASFLAGLFAADGTAKTSRGNVVLASSSPDLRRGVRLLLWELGIRSWDRNFRVTGRNDQGVVSINGFSLFAFAAKVGFGWHEEKNRLLLEKVDRRRAPAERLHDAVVSIGAGPFSDVYDLTMPNAHSFIADTLDVHNCNLGSLNLARFEGIEEFTRAVDISTAFLLCGTLYSKVPYEEVAVTRAKNRRLGLGLMGIYEWLAVRGKRYGPDSDLAQWLDKYEEVSAAAAEYYAGLLGVSIPVKTRAIAPTGTIGILAETTTGMEPMLAAAYKRRYLKGKEWHFQYVVDATAKRLIDKGVDPSLLEDAYDLAEDPGRRLAFQGWLQQWVDHGISSTLNLPARDQQNFTVEEFGLLLLEHLPNLRGVTVYPDGARGAAQPLTKVPLEEALGWEGYEYVEAGNEQACLSGSCGV